MDRKRRQEIIDQQTIQEAVRAERQQTEHKSAQVAYNEVLDALEARGIDLDALTEIYGKTVLSARQKEPVERLVRILDAIDGPDSQVILVGHTDLDYDRSVADARNPQELVTAQFALFESPSKCKLEFVRDADQQQTSLVLSGMGYRVSDRELPDPDNEPGEIKVVIAQRYYGENGMRQIFSSFDYNFLKVLDPNSKGESVWNQETYLIRDYSFGTRSPKAGRAIKWLLEYETPESRQRWRERNM